MFRAAAKRLFEQQHVAAMFFGLCVEPNTVCTQPCASASAACRLEQRPRGTRILRRSHLIRAYLPRPAHPLQSYVRVADQDLKVTMAALPIDAKPKARVSLIVIQGANEARAHARTALR